MFHDNHFSMWFGYHLIEGVGNYTLKTLQSNFENPEIIPSLELDQLKTLFPKLEDDLLLTILKGPDLLKVKQNLDFCQRQGIKVLPLHSPLYPNNLKTISNPPPFLYVKGRWPQPSQTIAVVGTRHPSEYGEKVTQKMVEGLTQNGFTIVSGLARGIDTIAHKETLLHGGHTIAVLGAGLGVKPSGRDKELRDSICEKGAIISELPLFKRANKLTFPMRNRIISALSLGTLVMEAGDKSGALITSTYAKQHKKPVFALPGSVYNLKSRGTNQLIRGGAELVTHPKHIFNKLMPAKFEKQIPANLSIFSQGNIQNNTQDNKRIPADISHNITLNHTKKPPSIASLGENEKKIVNILKNEMDLDQLRKVSGSIQAGLITILLTLESKGVIQRKPGSIYSLV